MMNNFHDFSLTDWLEFLENRHTQEIQLGLARIRKVAERLNLLQVSAHVITVAGTNGKGSTVSALETIYCTGKYNVASYTSPHLLAFNERIRVNQNPIPDKMLCTAFCVIEEARGDILLTYFEVTTLAALWYFQQFKLDVIILEVGMGGRQDATNILDSDLAIITTIDLDHQHYLGDNREAIGYEKAGILRRGNPLIYADYDPPASIVNEAHILRTPLFSLGTNYSFNVEENYMSILLPDHTTISTPIPKINHKAAVAAIIAASHLNSKLPVSLEQIKIALQNTVLPGRQQIIQGTVRIVLDVAHNPQAAILLSTFMKQYKTNGKIHAVFSALKDKDLYGLINALSNDVDFWYPATLNGKRAASREELLTAFNQVLSSTPVCFERPEQACRAAQQQAKPGDTILVYGSFLTVSAVTVAMKQESYNETYVR